ncbi:hypothetical protein LASUN_07390 [Lentilactobacillus sunkii]|uniref:Uncharacterized protein n=2 Tax=Lentilactobacillus sunkii TaxID=481719 RepID=A0A1E7XGH5_9LACO|nr:hypothetical protein [Lentilactobacillus sunkii]OFA12187.1 hypothetical protein LASUN_07390 [Lentilactobacillus sunkii]
MFQKISSWVYEQIQTYDKKLNNYFDKHPNRRKIFEWILNNNPLSGGYDELTAIAFGIIAVILVWIVKNIYF